MTPAYRWNLTGSRWDKVMEKVDDDKKPPTTIKAVHEKHLRNAVVRKRRVVSVHRGDKDVV